MFVEALAHLFALDLGWFVSLIIGNLLLLFAFIATMYIFLEGKKVIAGVIFLTLVLWIIADIQFVTGWLVFVGGFLSIYYITKLALLIFVEDTKLKKWLIPVSTAHAYLIIIIYNYFMV